MKIRKIKFRHSVSMRIPLVMILLLVGVVPMLIQSGMLIGSSEKNIIEDRMKKMQNQVQIISNKMTRTGYLNAIPRDTALESEMNIVADVFNGRMVVIGKNYKVLNDTFKLANGKTNISEEIIRCFQGENITKYNSDKHYFAITVPIYDSTEAKGTEGVIVMTASSENILELTASLTERSSFLNLMMVWLIFVFAALLMYLLMRPFKELQGELERVADGALDTDISAETYKETRQISNAVNRTITKLKEVDQSRQEFVSNVSHELKTPITSIRVLADSLMGMEEVPIELYREFMMDISDEIDRESKIIDDLLSLVKMDKSATEMNMEQVDINRLLELILKRLRPIAKKRNIELIFESIREVTADVDEVKLSLALNNLVENAVKYNVEAGWVRVTLDADHKFFYVKVADSGIGIPEEFHERIFDRFYRVDKARSRETGGTGLGLAITKSVVLMHHGALKLQSQEGEGTTFTVRIPLTYIS